MGFNCTFMELKCRDGKDWGKDNISFNCTFMELKYSDARYYTKNIDVLIVPLWN